MKKSSIIIAAGCFIVLTAFLCINNSDEYYKKQRHFSNISEVMESLQSGPIRARNERGDMEETGMFKECISKRKRMTDSQCYFQGMSIKKEVDLTDEEEKAILDDYVRLNKNLGKSVNIDKVQAKRIIADLSYNYRSEDNYDKAEMSFVFIDEGEGWVIDYIKQKTIEKSDDEKGDINVEG